MQLLKPGFICKLQPQEKPPMQGIARNILIKGQGDLEFQVVLDGREVHMYMHMDTWLVPWL